MLKLNVQNETSRLQAVVLGTADSNGPTPLLEEAYDPKSAEHIKAGTYPVEVDMVKEMDAVAAVFAKYDVQVFRPEVIENCNQIFARDIAFVVDDKIIKANILPDREQEFEAIEHVWSQVDEDKRIVLPQDCHIEGGDVMLWNDSIFIGTYSGDDYPDFITARTNKAAVEAMHDLFPNKEIIPFELRKSNINPMESALHLDCCFQPVGTKHAILHKNGFLIDSEYEYLRDYFGADNVFEITKKEMATMHSNIFSISEEVVISERGFTRLNTWLTGQGFIVEEIPYAEVAKQGGLLRCSTMPLIRD